MKFLLFALLGLSVWAQSLKVASYNVENLFDLHKAGSEYAEFIPYGPHGWNKAAYTTKVAHIARVLCDLKPDIVGLQEIESDRALAALQRGVKACGWPMPYRAIADRKPTAVKTALLSRYPVTARREIDPDGTLKTRDILEATLRVDGRPLIVFVNHWKSRRGPESARLVSARALMRRLRALPPHTDYILLGDFNSDWQEWRTLPRSPRLNDTRGLTGINHILQTVVDDKPVTKRTIRRPQHYDLWFELPPQRRWSHNFYGHKTALDHILLPSAMFDGRGIDYVDRSFRVFKPTYLFTKKGAVNRWQRDKKGRHLGRGYSDHLPIYALFQSAPYRALKAVAPEKEVSPPASSSRRRVHVADLYREPLGWTNLLLTEVVVLYKKGPNAILKERGGRGILVYRDVKALRVGHAYRIAVRKLYDYKGLREITKLEVLKDLGRRDTGALMLDRKADPADPEHVNEVVAEITGIYRRGYLHYAPGKKIRLYIKNRRLRPKNGQKVRLENVRISLYRRRLELVVE